MARIALGLLTLALFFGAAGCTWTETYNEFPPTVGRSHPAHDHPLPLRDGLDP
jgi:hypothetical protein